MRKSKLSLITIAMGAALLAGCNDKSEVSIESLDIKNVNVSSAEHTISTNDMTVKSVNLTDTVNAVEEKVEKAVTVSTESGFVAQEGVHYKVLKEKLNVESEAKIVLSEFFWFACSHCQSFEPSVTAWIENISKIESFEVEKTGVPGSQRWNFDAAVFQTMKLLGATKSQYTLMLKLYETDRIKNKSMPDQEKIALFFEEVGFNKEEALAILSDTDKIQPLLDAANLEYNKVETNGVPAFVVNGKYKIIFKNMKSNDEIEETIVQLGNK